jgi:site-specific recombinase XerD
MAACGGDKPVPTRNRALIALMYRAGLRVSEALDLYPKDVDLDAGAVRVLNGKGGRSRTVGLDPGAAAVVRTWLAVRVSDRIGEGFPLLCTWNGGRVSESYVRVLMARLRRNAGIAKRVHAHGLRHTHAAQLRAEGVDIGIISKQLGHRSIATTARYLDHIAPYQVIQVMQRREWQPAAQAGAIAPAESAA